MILSVNSFSQKVGIFDGQSDVGKVLHAGKAVYNSTTGDYSVSGSGANIWFTNDQFHFVWKKMKGDFNFCHSEVVAHGFPVRFCNRTNPDEKASIAARGSVCGRSLSFRRENVPVKIKKVFPAFISGRSLMAGLAGRKRGR